MAFEPLETVVTVGDTYGKNKAPNIVLEKARFYGRPNFSGELDRFKDTRRKFTVLIPNDVADQLRAMGYNVKTEVPTRDRELPVEQQEELSHLKVFINYKFDEAHPGDVDYEKGPEVYLKSGEQIEKLTSRTIGLLDRARILEMDMEIRGWEYDPEDAAGMLSARLVQLVAVIRPSIIGQKYGLMG